MNASATAISKIQAFIVREHARMGTLQRNVGMHMLTVEGRIYDLLSKFCVSYDGGLWRFHQLSNGGFYMSPPDGRYEFEVEGNGFRGGSPSKGMSPRATTWIFESPISAACSVATASRTCSISAKRKQILFMAPRFP